MKKLIENAIYAEVTKFTNYKFANNKTAALALNLFLRVPIVVHYIQNDNATMPTDLATFFPSNFTAYVTLDNTTVINMKITYADESQLKKILALIKPNSELSDFLGFVYLHELFHIVHLHITKGYNNMMEGIIGRHPAPELTDLSNHHLINSAEDYFINQTLADLLGNLKFSIADRGLFSTKYKDLSDTQILEKLLDDIKSGKTPLSSSLNPDGSTTISDGKSSATYNKDDSTHGDQQSTHGKSKQVTPEKLGDLANSIKQTIKDQSKGSQAANKLNELFDSIEVHAAWFDKLKSKFKREVFYQTKEFTTTWSSLNSTYRHIFKSPKRKYYDYKLELYLLVDSSASMGTEELARITGLIESQSRRIYKLDVVIHTTTVDATFSLKSNLDITKDPEFKQVMNRRHVNGGTSHVDAFKYIQENISTPAKSIILVYSDFYSDVEAIHSNYPVIKQAATFWIHTDRHKLPTTIPGTHIYTI